MHLVGALVEGVLDFIQEVCARGQLEVDITVVLALFGRCVLDFAVLDTIRRYQFQLVHKLEGSVKAICDCKNGVLLTLGVNDTLHCHKELMVEHFLVVVLDLLVTCVLEIRLHTSDLVTEVLIVMRIYKVIDLLIKVELPILIFGH
jgi:hypothetical protein